MMGCDPNPQGPGALPCYRRRCVPAPPVWISARPQSQKGLERDGRLDGGRPTVPQAQCPRVRFLFQTFRDIARDGSKPFLEKVLDRFSQRRDLSFGLSVGDSLGDVL